MYSIERSRFYTTNTELGSEETAYPGIKSFMGGRIKALYFAKDKHSVR
jgi:hypothetical protein